MPRKNAPPRTTSEGRKEFRVVQASTFVSIAPVFATDPQAGANELLDSMIMKYIPAFQGVVLAHSNLQFLNRTAHIKGDCPFATCNVAFDATVWSPCVGMRLVGRINLCSPDHVSLLVHRTFNVSIPRRHIPTEQWEFEYGPADNDPQFGPDAAQAEDHDDNVEDEHHGGKWVHHLTGDPLGGADGILEFTVIGLTVANEMLSLLGSIQDDPFSSEHALDIATSSQSVAELEGDEVEEEDMLDEDEDRSAESWGRPPKPQAETQRHVRKQRSRKRGRHEQGLEQASSPGMEETSYGFDASQQSEGIARETIVGERLAQASEPMKAKKKRKKDSHGHKREETDSVPKEQKKAKKAKRLKVVQSDLIS